MFIYSKYKNAKISPYKLRLVINIIKKESNIINILNILKFTNKKASFLILKTINSAISNARNNFNYKIDNLKLNNIFINKGPVIKRIMFRARGRFDYIYKRTSIINVVLINLIN